MIILALKKTMKGIFSTGNVNEKGSNVSGLFMLMFSYLDVNQGDVCYGNVHTP